MADIEVQWIDHGREPQCAPNPQFPNGMDVDFSGEATKRCFVDLPYPASRCGVYVLTCQTCGQSLGVTTAGRVDDPRTITLACFGHILNPIPDGATEIILPDSPRIKQTPHPS